MSFPWSPHEFPCGITEKKELTKPEEFDSTPSVPPTLGLPSAVFKAGTWNVSGCSQSSDRDHIYQFLLSNQVAVACLQETRLTSCTITTAAYAWFNVNQQLDSRPWMSGGTLMLIYRSQVSFSYCSCYFILNSRSAFLSFSFNKYTFRFVTSSSRNLHILRAYRAVSSNMNNLLHGFSLLHIKLLSNTPSVRTLLFGARMTVVVLNAFIPDCTITLDLMLFICRNCLLLHGTDDSSGDFGGEGRKLGWLASGEADGGVQLGKPNADPS